MNIIANATLAVACDPYDFQRFEDGSTVDFDCSAERAPEGALISGDWEPTGGTQSLANLVGASAAAPTLVEPAFVGRTAVFAYTGTAPATLRLPSAGHA